MNPLVTAPVVLSALLFWVCVFVIFCAAQGTTPLAFFLGRYEAPPADLGKWKEAGIEASSGLVREERLILLSSGAAHLLHQIRYRNPSSRSIVSVGPETRVPRRRVSQRSER